ncbi:MAG: electron transfer flavoprotein subunit beta/FixA family protein [Sporolactobacillus sp.]
MNSLVIIKKVFDNEAIVTDAAGQIDPKRTPSIMSAYDKFALEAAVQLKEQFGGRVIALSLGEPDVETALKEALSLGADDAVLVADPALEGSDACAESLALAAAAKKLGSFDAVFAGIQTTDNNDSQLGPQLAELLGLPLITHAIKLEATADKVSVTTKTDENLEVIEAAYPVLITAEDSLNTPRYASIKSKMAAKRAKIKTFTLADLDISSEKVGTHSPTQIKEVLAPEKKTAGIVINEDSGDVSAKKLVELLAAAKLI